MTLSSIIRTVRRLWGTVVGVSLLGLAAALVYILVTPPTYASTAQVFVSTQARTSNADLLQGSSFAQQRVKSYARVAASPAVLEPVIRDLKLPYNATELSGRVTTRVPVSTVLIDITVRAESGSESARLANAVATSFSQVIDDLERPTGAGDSPVRVSVVKRGSVPSSPISPNTGGSLVVGLFLGLAAGIAAAVVRDSLDARIRNEPDLKRESDVPVLGSLMLDERSDGNRLIRESDQNSFRSESFRQIRTALQFVKSPRRPGCYLITSSVPGEGKTTTTSNLAVSIAQSGQRVCLIDADLRRPRVAEAMGMEGSVGLSTVLSGQAELDDVVQQWGSSSLYVLASGVTPPNPSELLGSEAMQGLLDDLVTEYDVVLIDAPPLLPVTDASVLASSCGGALLVVGCGRVNRHEFHKGCEQLAAVEASVMGVVLNRVPRKGPDGYGTYGYGYRSGEVYGYGDPVALEHPQNSGPKSTIERSTIVPSGQKLRATAGRKVESK